MKVNRLRSKIKVTQVMIFQKRYDHFKDLDLFFKSKIMLDKQLWLRRKHEIDTKLLLHAIQRTGNFESLLSRRFAGVTLKQYEEKRKEAEERGSGNPFEEEEAIDDPNNPFFENKTNDKVEGKNNAEKPPSAASTLLTPFSGIIRSTFISQSSVHFRFTLGVRLTSGRIIICNILLCHFVVT